MSKSDQSIPPLRYSHQHIPRVAFSDQEKAQVLNDHFSAISTIDDTNVNLPEFSLKCVSILSDIVITVNDVFDVLSTLDIGKAVGPDKISHRMLKATARTISSPLSLLFNRSLSESSFPTIWKKAHVIPLFKKGDPHLPLYYRPISLLSCVSKVMERCVFKYVFNFARDNELFYKYQSGFLPGHSTVYQLIELFHNIASALDRKEYSCIVFCDLSKAFDKVWHKGLLFKLCQYGTNGNLLPWFSSYLSSRQQAVTYGNATSSFNQISAGVPQGSVLGPLLFLFYINDLVDPMKSVTRLFADDSSLQETSSDLNEIENNLNHDIKRLQDWSDQWLMQFNPAKTKAILFSTRPLVVKPNLSCNNEPLAFTDSHCHLGVFLSSNCNWHDRIHKNYFS